jgi:nucleotide-binding universal stress UspA family protein
MGDVKRILCPVDFSETSRAALKWAVQLREKFGAQLTLLHVFQPPALSLPDGVAIAGPDVLSDLQRQVEENMKVWRDDAIAMGAKDVEIDTALGATYPEITRYAQEKGFDLIVIGTHGRTGLAHAILGSTAEKVVQHATCPVLTVRGSKS